MAEIGRMALVVLAAGASVRWGPGSKLVAPYNGQPLLSHILAVGARLRFRQRVVVTGPPYRDAVASVLSGFPEYSEAFNKNAGSGIGSSIAVGVAAISDSDGAFICLGDMPNIVAGDFEQLLQGQWTPNTIRRPSFRSRPGHPVLFGRAHYPSLSELDGRLGASSIIGTRGPTVLSVPTKNAGVLEDLDTPADFDRSNGP